MTQAHTFPAPEPGDAEDVAWTLQTGGTMWARGDHHEAVRWLRRAAEAAGDAGDDLRAFALAKTAADLTTALQLPPSIPPPAATPSPAAVAAPPASTPHVPVPASSPRSAPSRPHPPKSRPDTQTEITAKIPPHALPVDDGETVHDYTMPDIGPRSPPPPPSRSHGSPPPSRSGPSAAPPPPSRSSPSAAPARSSPSAAPAPMGPRPRQALRVAVVPSPDDKSLLLVRALLDEEPVPAGAHEAILTALEPGAHLLSKKR